MDLVVTIDERGQETRSWKSRRRQFPTKKSAELFAVEVTVAAKRGEDTRHVDAREKPVSTLGAVGRAFIEAATHSPASTYRYRRSFVNAWLAFAGDTTAAVNLNMSLVERYARSLPAEARQAATRHRKVLVVQQMWVWAAERPERFPGVPPARRVTGRDADLVRAPPPVVAADAPSWADMDAMIAHLDQREWHRRLAIVLRYTGIRVGQGLSLAWRDVDLVQGILRLRAGVVGAKSGATRVVPMHPMLVEVMKKWQMPGRWVFPHSRDPKKTWETKAVSEPFRRAWEAAGVDRAKWDLPEDGFALVGDRSHGSPTHAFRRGVKVGLIRAGVDDTLANYLIGHKANATIAAYVPEATAASSPYWPRLVEVMAKIPPYEGPGV